ncbi:WD40 repeat domain-containing protein [Polyangium mundeleinium]|uniref:WD40 repeat domain-containing protein n=1 Tax=Polyangium mundeleinium TaxID=2995306 RepID=A0ABT5EFZ1_9BACT|nr:hypothetical protein [Polyangium mundeleinium]MDC0740728.1 hypothetical protein [Polyangium mundeleinium]
MNHAARLLCALAGLALLAGPSACGRKERPWTERPIRQRPIPLGPAPRLPLPETLPEGTPAPLLLAERRGGTRGDPSTLPVDGDFERALRGAVLPGEDGALGFVPHAARSVAPVGDGTWFVVASPTGLWLHETRTLAMRARLAPPPVLDVAASPDGTRIAYAIGKPDDKKARVEVVSFPSLAPLASFPDVAPPSRMRFSADGARVAMAGAYVNLLDITSRESHVVGGGSNDVFPMPGRPDQVAVASNRDTIDIHRVSQPSYEYVFDSTVLMNGYRAGHRGIARDQRAVTFDPVTGILAGGGDDNRVWRFAGERLLDVFELDGNVVDVACCTGKAPSERTAYFAVDNFSVAAVRLQDGKVGPWLAGINTHGTDWISVRLALLPDDELLVSGAWRLARWEPAHRALVVSHDYMAMHFQASVSNRQETLFVGCDGPRERCAVEHIAYAAPAADVATARVGEVSLEKIEQVIALEGGYFALIGVKNNHLGVAFVKPGTLPEPPIEVPGSPPTLRKGGHGVRADGAVAFFDLDGQVYEVTRSPRDARLLGKAQRDDPGRVVWDEKAGCWVLVGEDTGRRVELR